MMFGDSLEINVNDITTSAEPLSLNPDINPSRIWIPAHALPNRQEPRNLNENVPTMHHTLEEPEVVDRFSVYSEDASDYNAMPPCLSSLLQMMRNDPALLKTMQKRRSDSMYRHMQGNCEKRVLDFEEMMKVMGDAKANGVPGMVNLGPLSHYVDEPSEKEENVDTSEDQTKTKDCELEPDKSSVSDADSLNEIYISDEEQNKSLFDVEIKKSYEQLSCETEAHDTVCLEENKCSNVETLNEFTIVHVKENPVKNQNIVFDELQNKDVPKAKHDSNESEQKTICEDESLNALAQKIEKYTIAYQKPTLEKQVAKTKTSKQKRVKKKGKRYLPLDIISQEDDKSRFEKPEVDLFYQSLVQRGICKTDEQMENMNISPLEHVNLLSNTVKDKLKADSKPSFVNEISKDKAEEIKSEICEKDTLKTIITENLPKDLIREHLSSTVEEEIELKCTKIDSKPSSNEIDQDKTKNMKSEICKEDTIETIIIENIPKDVTREHIENIVLGYGELKNLTIESHGNALRAELKMDFICEVDWIIDCLNESQPFGVFDEEKLKCYKLKE